MTKKKHIPTIELNGYRIIEEHEQLKCCPFCNSDAEMIEKNAYYGMPAVIIRCTKCYVQTLAEAYKCGVWTRNGWIPATFEYAVNKAVERWNRRGGKANE